MLTRLEVDHYKSINHLDIQLGPVALFVGVNGSGKSNVIDAIRLIRDAVWHGLDRAISDRHGIDSVRQWSPFRPYHVSLKAHVENSLGHGSLGFTLSSARGTYLVRREEGAWQFNDPSAPPSASYTRDEDGRVRIDVAGDERQELRVRAELREELFLGQSEARRFRILAIALRDFEAYSIFPNTLRTPQKPSSDQQMSSSGDNLTSIFKMLTRSSRKDHVRSRRDIVEAMQKVMPQLENIRIQTLGGLMVPTFRVAEEDGRSHDFNVSQISDGTLRILGLLTALHQPYRPEVIAMEEPEQTVNPGIAGLIADTIREVGRTSQVLVTTHSPDLLDRFEDPEIVLAVSLKKGVTTVGKISSHQRDAVRDRLFSLGELLSVEGLHQ